jgi:type I restriction enzyme S subunit
MIKMDLNKLDKSNWKSVPFEKIASKISETVNPNKTDLEIYVGLEHIDTENIHIKRFGTPADVSGGKLKCYPGDVIFGKRRAYQRKAAIVDFEGICSAHAFVFRANPDLIDPKLFPFFLHSDQFMHRMVDISVGGLSPTINWGDLKHQEFLLPPKEEQTKLAELLWAMDEVIEKEKQTLLANNTLLKSIQKKLFLDNVKVKFEQEFEMIAGYSFKSEEFTDNGIAVVKIKDLNEDSNIVNCEGITDFIRFDSKYDKYLLGENDILMGLTGAKSGTGYVGKIGIIKSQDKLYLNQRVAKIIPKRFSTEFSRLLLTSDIFLNEVWIRCNEGAQANISVEDIMKCSIPNVNEISKLEEKSKLIFHSVENNKLKIEHSESLQKSLINQIF